MKELECSQDFSHYKSMGIFPDAQGQLTQQSLVESGPNSNLSEILWLSSLPVSMKKIRSKMKALACSQHFRVLIRSGPKPNASFSPYPMMLQIKFGCDWPTGLRDIHV